MLTEKFTATDVIKHVNRTTMMPKLNADGKPERDAKSQSIIMEPKKSALNADEILNFNVGDSGLITVVTTDGQKFTGQLPEKELKAAQSQES